MKKQFNLRSLFAITALSFTLSAQGMDVLVDTTEDRAPGIRKKQVEMTEVASELFSLMPQEVLTPENALASFNRNFSFLVGIMDGFYKSLSDDEKAFLETNDQARQSFQYPYGLARLLTPSWSMLNRNDQINLYCADTVLGERDLAAYQRTLIQWMIQNNPRMGFEFTSSDWEYFSPKEKNLLPPYVTYYQFNRLDPLAPGEILGRFPGAVRLSFLNQKIFPVEMPMLVEELGTNTILTDLNLKGAGLGNVGARGIAQALETNTNLTTLDLSANEIGNEGAQAIAQALETNTALADLNLSGNEIGNEGTQAIAQVLETNTAITTLNLSENNIGVVGGGGIVQALEVNTTLTTLHLSGNPGMGVTILNQILAANTTLTALHFNDNGIGDAGGLVIAQALATNTNLTTLGLSHNRLHDAGGRAILEALRANPNPNLKKLRLSMNQFSMGLQNEFRTLAQEQEFEVIL